MPVTSRRSTQLLRSRGGVRAATSFRTLRLSQPWRARQREHALLSTCERPPRMAVIQGRKRQESQAAKSL
jgi:hypothetical protein